MGRRQSDVQAWRQAVGSLRVETRRLDRILDYTGEVAVAWGRVRELIGRLDLSADHELLVARDELQRLHLALQEEVVAVRMVPIGPALRRQIRNVRDLANRLGKKVRVVIEGEAEEIDATVVAHLADPLTHLIRNAIDHGIETPEQRVAGGKAETATVTLRAVRDAGSIVIEVADDGRGLEPERLLQRVREVKGEPGWNPASREELWSWIFQPGFSTREDVSELSGRGVGLDIVRGEVERLSGQISVRSDPDQGLCVALRLPLTLTVISGLEVGVDDERYLVPMASVTECVDLIPSEESRDRKDGVMQLRGRPLAYLRLRRFVGGAQRAPARENVVVVQHGDRRFGIAVDRVIGERPTVIKPLPGFLHTIRGVSGSTILPSGGVALILDLPALLQERLSP